MPLKRPSETSIICFFLFGLLPFVYLPVSQDPELTLRYLMLTVLLVSIGILMIFRKLPITTHFWKEPVLLTFGGYLVVTILSLTKTINSGDGVYELTKIIVCFIFLLLMIQLLRNRPEWISKLPLFVTFAAFVFSIIGLFQFIPMIIDSLSQGTIFAIKNNVTSTLSNKNFFAETLVISLPFSVYTFICHKSYLRWGALFTAITSFLLILIIQSASVYFAITIQLLVAISLLFFYRKLFRNTALSILYKTRFLVFTAIAILIIPVSILVFFPDKIDYSQLPRKWVAVKAYVKAPDKIFEKDNVKNNNSVYDRLFLARNSILMAKENPILGIGVSNWKILYPKYGLYGNNFMSVGTLRFEHPHNDYLLVLCESGIIGLLSWLAFLGFILITAVRNIKKVEHPEIRILLLLLLLSLISFMCTSLFGYPKERFFSMLLLLCLTAIIVALKETKPQTLKSSNKIFLFFSIGILITISWIHLERYRSEIYVNAALHQQKKSAFLQMQQLIEKAKSPFQIVDMTSTPLEWHLGQAFYYQGNHVRAFDHYKKAALQNPFHMQVLNDLGALYEEKGDHVSAMNCFDRVFAMNPDFPDARMNLVAVYFNTGETEKAFDILKNHPYKYSEKWYVNMKIILLSKAEKQVQSTQDTLLADLLNKRIQYNPNYLMSIYSEALRDSITFEKKLKTLK